MALFLNKMFFGQLAYGVAAAARVYFNKTLDEKKFALQKNDRIVLYTDGVISAENSEGEQYGEQRFHEAIRRQGAMNSAAFVNFIAGGVDKFLEESEQNDDITICTFKRMK